MLCSVYPRPGGLRANLELFAPDIDCINCEGPHIVYSTLDQYKKERSESLPDVFDVLSCDHGCNSGPGVGTDYSVFRMEMIMHDVKTYTSKMEKKQHTLGKSNQFAKFYRKLKLGT